MSKVLTSMKRIIKRPVFIISFLTLILLIGILIIYPIGMADNGDYYRVMVRNDLYFLEEKPEEQFFGYFVKDFGIREYFNEMPKEDAIFTSQNLFIKLSIMISQIVTNNSNRFDVRILGGMQIILCVVGIYLLVDFLTYKKTLIAGLLIGFLCMLVFADTAYTAYFNSLYAEGLSYTTFLIIFSSALLIQQKRYSPYFLYSLIFINSVILIFLKQQYAPIGILLAGIFVIIGLRESKKIVRRVLYGLGGFMVFMCIAVYVLIPQEFVTINQYHAMTRGILMTSEDPEKSLSEFSINEQYSILNGDTYYDKHPQTDTSSEDMYENFFSKYNFVSVSMYYIKHPNQLWKMISYSSNNGYMIRPEVLGNYVKESGKEWGEKTNLFTAYSTIKKDLAPKSAEFLLIWCVLAILLNLKNPYQMKIILIAVLIGLSQIGVSIIGAGDADLGKHIFLYTVVFDFVNVIGFSYVINKLCEYINHKIIIRRKQA